MFTNSNRVSPVPLIPAEEFEMDPAYPPAGGRAPVGFEDVEMNAPEGPEVPAYAPQQEYPAVGIGEYPQVIESSLVFASCHGWGQPTVS